MVTVNLAPLDWAIVGLFLAAILSLGFSARLREISALQFIAAGRMLTLPVFVATLVSTWYGGILGIGESVSFFGLGTWVLMGLPYYVFALLYGLVWAKRVRSGDEITIPERLGNQFGRAPALVGAGLVFLLGVPAAHVLMLGVLAQALTGWMLIPSILVGALVGVAFLYKGGLLADARVSLLAFAMMYIGFGVIAVYCLAKYPPRELLAQFGGQPLLAWDGGTGWPYVVSFFILGAWTLVDPGFHQRVASARDPETGRRGVLVAVGFWMLFDVLSITAGMYALGLVKTELANPLLIFPALGEQVLPAGLKAVFVCGMLGTVLSAMVGYTLVSGAAFGRELVARLRPGADEAQTVRWTRAGLIVACGTAVVLAASVQSVVSLWYAWGGAITGALLLPVAASYGLVKLTRVGSAWIAASMAISFALALVWMVYGIATENPYLAVNLPGGGQFSVGTLLPGLAISATVLGLGTLAPRARG